jgi:hypothetical protein
MNQRERAADSLHGLIDRAAGFAGLLRFVVGLIPLTSGNKVAVLSGA